MERYEMVRKGKMPSETQCSFDDSVLQNSDLSLLKILHPLQNENGIVSETSSPSLICASTAGLINTLASTTTVEDTIRIIEQNIKRTLHYKNPSLEQKIMGV